jgi:NAD(P)-dependent dehydrogenase (short-subunit alcohol dehydrogenase family)
VASNSRLHKIDFDDLNSTKSFSKFKAYGQSKVANMLFTLELDRRLKEAAKNTETVAVLPGRVVGKRANPVLFAATSEVVSGRLYGQDYPSEEIVDPEMVNYDDAERLWEISEKLTGIDFYIKRANEPDLSVVSTPDREQKNLI